MHEGVVLYDLSTGNYPRAKGSSFRTKQIFRCYVCTATTNEVFVNGWWGEGVCTLCPHAAQVWHHRLIEYLQAFGRAHPLTGRLIRKCTTLAVHNIVGKPDTLDISPVEYVCVYRAHELAGKWDILEQLRREQKGST